MVVPGKLAGNPNKWSLRKSKPLWRYMEVPFPFDLEDQRRDLEIDLEAMAAHNTKRTKTSVR